MYFTDPKYHYANSARPDPDTILDNHGCEVPWRLNSTLATSHEMQPMPHELTSRRQSHPSWLCAPLRRGDKGEVHETGAEQEAGCAAEDQARGQGHAQRTAASEEQAAAAVEPQSFYCLEGEMLAIVMNYIIKTKRFQRCRTRNDISGLI